MSPRSNLFGILVIVLSTVLLASCGGGTASVVTAPTNRASEPPTILFGDSITSRWTPLPSDWPTHRYVNKGVPNEMTSDMLLRFDSDVTALRPRLVVILAGANDVVWSTDTATVVDNLLEMVYRAKAAGTPVILCTLTPMVDPAMNSRVQLINSGVRQLAEQQAIPMADYYNAMAGQPGLLDVDGIHPTARGYAVMGAVLKPML